MLNNYFTNKLNNNQRSKVSYIIDGIRKKKKEITLYGLDFGDVKQLIFAVLLDNPDLYYCILQLVNIKAIGTSVKIELQYCDCNIREFETKYDQIINILDKQINDKTSAEEKIKIIYDYLGHNIDYDHQALRLYQDLNLDDDSNIHRISSFMQNHGKSFTVYGAVVNNKSVCMGFSMLFKMLLNNYGIASACLPGDHKVFNHGCEVGRYNHMINVVEINGQYAYVDSSKALFVKDKMICYDYFLMPKNILNQYFVLNDWVIEDYRCDTLEYSILYQNKLIFTSYHDLRKYLFRYTYELNNGNIRFYYNNRNQKDEDLRKLVDDIISRHCGSNFSMTARRIRNGFGNCLVERK